MNTDEKIIELYSQGKTYKEIGKVLFMSPKTVDKRLMKLREKYDCKKTIQLLDIFKAIQKM